MSEVNKAITLQQAMTLYDDLRDRQEALVKSYEQLTFPVNKGTLCLVGKSLRIANQDILTSEVYTPAHWEETDISEELTDVKNAIQGKYTKPSGGIPASDIADGVIPVVDSALSDSSENAIQNKVVKGALDTKAPVIINTATGNPAVFNDGCGLPLKSMLIPFTQKQEGSGDPSPENIRPILPWNGLTVWNGGKNLLNPVAENLIPFEDTSYNRYTLVNGQIITTGNSLVGFLVEVKEQTKYAFSFASEANAILEVFSYSAKPNKIRNADTQIAYSTGKRAGFTTPQGCKYVVCAIVSTVSANVISDFQLEAGQTASAFEQFVPITETDISFTSPVYGGTLDVVSGVLTVEWAKITLDGRSTSGIFLYDSGNGFRLNPKNIYLPMKSGANLDGVCNIMPTVKVSTGYGCRFGMNSEYIYLVQCMDVFGSTVAEFLQYLTTHNLELCYPLATPQEIQLTPQQINAIKGDNTIWSDADESMTVEYHADTALFIANQHRNFIAPELSSMIADTALVKNDFRIVGDNLYKITTAIASGGTLTPGTNCTKTTLAEVIKPLLT